MIRILPRLLAAMAMVLVAVPIGPDAAAADPVTPTLTWAVQPADAHGPDGRRWVERTLDPGQVVTEHLAVRNLSARTVVFGLKAADGYLTDKGRFTMLSSDRTSVDGGTWIAVQDTVTVGANQVKVVPFTIRVPAGARPGDHPAGIAATVTSGGGSVAVEGRVGFRVMTRVSGTLTAALGVDGFTATYRHSWNPFSAGTVKVGYTATNAGNVAATGAARVTTAELFGLARHGLATTVEEMLPGGRRDIGTTVHGVWGLGRIRMTVDLTPSAVGDAPGAVVRPASVTVTVWALPWPQFALTVLFAAAVVVWRAIVRRRRRRLADLLDRARAEGRELALAAGAPAEPGT